MRLQDRSEQDPADRGLQCLSGAAEGCCCGKCDRLDAERLRSVSYQTSLYEKKTNYYKQQGYDDAKAKEMAAAVVNPPGYSEHNCGLAADLNSPEHTGLDEGFENTTAFRCSASTPGSTGLSCATPRGPRRRPRSPMSPGTGAMWAWKTPRRSTPAACALRTISPPCSRSRAERQSAGEETVKSSVCRLQFGL